MKLQERWGSSQPGQLTELVMAFARLASRQLLYSQRAVQNFYTLTAWEFYL